MDNASCSTIVTEFDTKEIVPIAKFVPFVIRAAAQKVKRSTGTSAHVSEVNNSTEITTIATRMLIICISLAICFAGYNGNPSGSGFDGGAVHYIWYGESNGNEYPLWGGRKDSREN